MFKIIRAEIKKTFAKHGIFILTGVLIVVLFACAMLYKPAKRDNIIITVQNNVSASKPDEVTIDKMFNYFNDSVNGKENAKNTFNGIIDESKNFIDFYYCSFYPSSEYIISNGITVDTSENVLLNDISGQVSEIITNWGLYKSAEYNGYGVSQARNDLKVSLNKLVSQLKIVGSSKEKTTILIQNLDFENFSYFINKSYLTLDTLSLSDDDVVKSLGDSFQPTLEGYVKKIYEFKPEQSVLDSAINYINLAKEYLGVNALDEEASGLIKEIIDFKNEYSSNKDKNIKDKFNILLTKYKLIAQEVKTVCYDLVYTDVLDKFSPNEITNYKTFENENFYRLKEDLAKNEYFLNTLTFDFEYATPFSITQSSNTNINAFDFAYFALKLCSFIIIIYCVVLAAGSIAGEQQSGTLKLLAIRPYSRIKLLSGKLLATILVGMILLTLSAVATNIAGIITYSINSLPVLIIFNGSTVFSVPVFVEFLLMLLTMFFELVFFVIMAYGISTIFKSNVGAVAISIMIYFVSLILNTMASSISALRFLPFTNMNLFKYFGSSFLSNSSGFLFSVLTPSVVIGADFWFSFLISGLFAIFVLIITMIVFKKRDLK